MFRSSREKVLSRILLLVVFSFGAMSAQAAEPSAAPKQLSGNASSLNETYADWQVMCQESPIGTRCAATQQVFRKKSHDRLLNIQLAPQQGITEGIIVVPLGVSLAKGLILRADKKTVLGPIDFTACVTSGCIAQIKLSTAQLDVLQKSKKINVKLSSIRNQDIILPISGNGLQKAVTRLNALVK